MYIEDSHLSYWEAAVDAWHSNARIQYEVADFWTMYCAGGEL